MDLGPIEKQAITATDPAGPAHALAPSAGKVPRGSMIGRFIVIDQLGAGAGGLVVSAFDPDLDRKVALKVLRPDQVYSGSIGRARERLLREAKAVARIADPNIITIHEAGSVGDQVYVAMEYIDGGTLRDTLSLRRRGWQQVLALLVPAARGLAAAHEAGLVHRDFKPANVLVSRDNRVIVSDFGLVSTTQDQDESASPGEAASTPRDPSLTDTGTTLGTPAYMAPEQHRGADVDARSDQFAYCVTLFEALYGTRPFAGNTLLELMTAKDTAAFVRTPSADVPSWLRQIVIRGLSPDPSKRFGSMAELIAAIEANQSSQSRRAWLGLAAIAVAIPIAVLAYRSLTKPPPPKDNVELAELRATVAQKDDELRRNHRELEELRGRPQVDPADVVALEVRNAELKAEVDRLLERLTEGSREPSRPVLDRRPRPGIEAASRFELPGRERSGPPLPDRPEKQIVASVFSGIRSDIERCANIPDMDRNRNWDEWSAVMDRPIDYDIDVSLTIEPNGRPSKVRVSAHNAGVRTCVAVAVRRARFPVSVKGGPARYAYSLID